MLLPRKLRLIVWIVAVIGVMVGHQLRSFPMVIGCLAAIFALLCTTPDHAIRLPRGISEVLIFGGSMGLQFASGRRGVSIHLILVILMLLILRLWRRSPWWTVLYAWW